MDHVPPPPVPTQLIVFADDWGRHPSSSQHVIRELLPHYPTLWVNTVGTRLPRLTWEDFQRAHDILSVWFTPKRKKKNADLPEGLSVIAPGMYPGYRMAWQRRFNVARVEKAVNASLRPNHRHVVMTTLPITADLVGRLNVDRWLYYCVDDYSKWPGVDHAIMDEMEQILVDRCDALVAVSDVLSQRLRGFTQKPLDQIHHGVDLQAWQTPNPRSELPKNWPDDRRPVILFWGLIDSRMQAEWLYKLSQQADVEVLLVGPNSADASTALWNYTRGIGSLPYQDLPACAATSNVLIMPYIDAPVTRAMQPLKLKEYLATMKPVVVRDLPSTREWEDCCDLASDGNSFVRLVQERIITGTPPQQIAARKRRLASESWTAKAIQLAELINAE